MYRRGPLHRGFIPPPDSCHDTDPYLPGSAYVGSYYWKGNVTGWNDGNAYIYKDYCATGNTNRNELGVVEYICNSTTKKPETNYWDCTGAYDALDSPIICTDGKCVDLGGSPRCSDDCRSIGDISCSLGKIKTCGKCDSDICLDWCNEQTCPMSCNTPTSCAPPPEV